MFSEDNILHYCAFCKNCDEVRRCPVRAEIRPQRISGEFIPVSALESTDMKDQTLFKHIEKGMLTIRNLSEDLNKLNKCVFKQGPGTGKLQ